MFVCSQPRGSRLVVFLVDFGVSVFGVIALLVIVSLQEDLSVG